jgi:bifunctional non-homologous end joining protein LigD
MAGRGGGGGQVAETDGPVQLPDGDLAPLPAWLEPELATLTSDRFSDTGWIFERKLDGERCLVFREGPRARLMTRNKKEITATYPELAEALAGQPDVDFVADGEIVAFERGRTSFARLQQRMQVRRPDPELISGVRVYFYLFDLMFVGGHDIRVLPLRERKGLLRELVSFGGPLRFTAHRNADGEAYFRQACGRGWEGLIAKRADAPYRAGRSRDWLKFKCENAQEFVIGGYTEPRGARSGFGALLLGYYLADGRLAYAGKVGTGFDGRTLASLHATLAGLERPRPPFGHGELPRAGVHWTEPRLVAQVGFAEWTTAGQLRHPRYLGLREDKAPADVVREKAS